MAKSKMNLKGRDALDECIRLWRLNDTFKGRIVDTAHAMWSEENQGE